MDNPYPYEKHNFCRCDKAFCSDPWCYISLQGIIQAEECGVRDCMECDSGELKFKIQLVKHIKEHWEVQLKTSWS